MGQKSNLNTVRQVLPDISLSTFSRKKFVYSLNFSKFWSILLQKKNVLCLFAQYFFVGNSMFLFLFLFYKSLKLRNYRKRMKMRTQVVGCKNFFRFLFESFQKNFFNLNTIFLRVVVMNKFLNKQALKLFYYRNKKYIKSLFSRRLPLFLDFIKLQYLFLTKSLATKSFLSILSQIFSTLPKHKHGRFFSFLKESLNFIVFGFQQKHCVCGVKLVINGKLKGKTRATSIILTSGSVPAQTISLRIEFCQLHAHTIYGVFGFNFWVNRN